MRPRAGGSAWLMVSRGSHLWWLERCLPWVVSLVSWCLKLKHSFSPISSFFSQGIFSIRQAFLTILINVAGVDVLRSAKESSVLGLSLLRVCIYPSAWPLHY